MLRKAWVVNGCFYNSEVWLGFSENDLHDLTIIDHKILRLIIGAQPKVPVEMLYLETSQVPVKDVISVKRLLYLQEILTRPTSELILQIYTAMKENTLKDDWIHLIYEDMNKFNINLSDEQISLLRKQDFKKIVKSKMRKTVFIELENIKQGHSKVRDIQHYGLKYPKPYLSSLSSVSYSDIFSDMEKQYKITQLFECIIQTREKLRALPAYPGYNTGPADD